jgi:hypothetical protein
VVLVDEYVSSLQRSSQSLRGAAATAPVHGAYHIGVALASAAVLGKPDTHLVCHHCVDPLCFVDAHCSDIDMI